MQGFGTQWSLWCTQAWNICLAIMNQVAFPASELLRLSRPPCDITEWWFMGLLANGLLGSPFGQCKNIFITLFSISKYEGCWVNCQCLVKSSRNDAHVESNKAVLEHEPSNLYPKFGPDIRKGFLQLSNWGSKCPLRGITKSLRV